MKMNYFQKGVLAAAVALTLTACGKMPAKPAPQPSAVGLCTHFMHPVDDIPYMQQEFDAMKQLGCNIFRTDLIWNKIEKKPGEYDYSRSDRYIVPANQQGLLISAVIVGSDSSIPKQYLPLSQHLDEMEKFLRPLIRHYRGKVQYYEIGNEQDCSGPAIGLTETKHKPDVYMKIVRACSKVIRDEDPDAVILLGGLTQPGSDLMPFDFIEGMLKEDVAKYADIMNIHPYLLYYYPEDIIVSRFERLKKMMKHYKADKMKIWGTEFGDCIGAVVRWNEFFPAAFKEAKVDPAATTLYVVNDPSWKFFSENRYVNRADMGVQFKAVKEIKLKDLDEVPASAVLLWNSTGDCPTVALKPFEEALKRGVTVIIPIGLPFYQETIKAADGYPDQGKQVNDKYLPAFHIAWDTYWTKKDLVPNMFNEIKGPGFDGCVLVGRSISTRNLKPGDQFVPLVTTPSKKKGETLPVAGVFHFNSDLKGKVIMTTAYGRSSWNVTEENSAKLTSRQLLMLRTMGEEVSVIYKLRRYPHQKKYTFGIFTPDFQMTPAGKAIKFQNELIPTGSTFKLVKEGTPWLVKAVTPAGKTVYAAWMKSGSRDFDVKVEGTLEKVVGNDGTELQFEAGKPFTLSDTVTYFVGPDKLKFE